MPVATAHAVSLHGRRRPPDRRPDRRVARPGRDHAGRPARHVAQRGPRPVPDGDHQQRARLAGHQADHGPALARRPAQARHPLRPGGRGVGPRRRGSAAGGVPGAHRRSSASSPSTGGLRSVPGCCRWCSRRPSAGIRRVFVPEPQAARGRDGARDVRSSGCARWPRWWRSCAGGGPRGAAGRAVVRAAGCSPGAARSGWRRSTWPTCSAWPTPATPSRSRPPAVTTCCCRAPRAPARPASPSGSRASCPT